MQCMSHQVLLTREILYQKWKILAALTKKEGAAKLKLSNGWLDSTKVRTSLKDVKRNGEGQFDSVDHANQERALLQKNLYDFQSKDIFSMDEMDLFYAIPPSKNLSSRTNANSVKQAK